MGTLCQHNGLKSDCYSLIEHSAYISKSVLNQYALNPLYTVAMQNQLKSEVSHNKAATTSETATMAAIGIYLASVTHNCSHVPYSPIVAH